MSSREPITLSTGRVVEYVPDQHGVEWWLVRGDHNAEMTEPEYDEFASVCRERAKMKHFKPIITHHIG